MEPVSLKTEGWEARLMAAVQSGFDRPFEWSVHDCATFAFGVRAALTGQDATPAWVGHYTSLTGGLRLMHQFGWANYAAMGSCLLGVPLPGVLLAQRGDIALGADGGFAVVTGQSVLGMAPHGMAAAPLADCRLVWRV